MTPAAQALATCGAPALAGVQLAPSDATSAVLNAYYAGLEAAHAHVARIRFPGASVSKTSDACDYVSLEGDVGPWLAPLVDLVEEFRHLQDGWNGYSAPAPSDLAISNTKEFLYALLGQKFEPSRIAPSAVGGIGVTYAKGSRTAYLELYNDGTAYSLLATGSEDPLVNPVPTENGQTSFQRLIDDIGDFLNG